MSGNISPKLNLGLLDHQKLAQITTAKTIGQATRITSIKDLIDSIIDWFKGGTRRETITRLTEAIASVRHGDLTDEHKRLDDFIELRNAVLSEHQGKFTISITGPAINGDWSYSLSIAGQKIYSMPETLPLRDPLLPRVLAEDLHNRAQADFDVHRAALTNPADFREANFQCMMESDTWRQLPKLQNDPAYGRTNFLRIEEHHDPAKFVAVFKDGKQLEFSNRTSSKDEFRGDRLKEALKNYEYRNLGELASAGHLTEQDVILKYALTPVRLESYLPARGLLQQHLGKNGDEALNRELWNKKVGNTTLGALWALPNAQVSAPSPDGPSATVAMTGTMNWTRG